MVKLKAQEESCGKIKGMLLANGWVDQDQAQLHLVERNIGSPYLQILALR